MNSPDDKPESLFAMLAAVGHLKSYQFPVVQMAMGNTMGAEPRRAENPCSLPSTGTSVMNPAESEVRGDMQPTAEMPTAPNPFAREAEELYMQFRRTEP